MIKIKNLMYHKKLIPKTRIRYPSIISLYKIVNIKNNSFKLKEFGGAFYNQGDLLLNMITHNYISIFEISMYTIVVSPIFKNEQTYIYIIHTTDHSAAYKLEASGSLQKYLILILIINKGLESK